ncbi:RidA family protein [Rhodovibrio salinarum]|uniref:RidA family protein n=1 Tax=Rhodovibrio salinarum TaxID=1087 RepID=A0A934QJB8_9PROT|nr:RidA family protein [Rhodovibrio salinarum]MBK1697757.1 RidA family protein [Rhodovibrio salinarum]
MERLRDPELDTGTTPLSHAVIDDRYVFVSGLVVADTPAAATALGDVATETQAVMTALATLLGRLDLSLAHVVRVTAHLRDLAEMPAFDRAYAAFFPNGQYPARTCVEVARLVGDCRVEITATARRH